jgi:hypothetical protein
MSYGRKRALIRLQGLRFQVEVHLRKISDNPASDTVAHWRKEILTWLEQMDAMLRQVGVKTAAQWAEWLAQVRASLTPQEQPETNN